MIMRDDVLQCDSKTIWRTDDFYYLVNQPHTVTNRYSSTCRQSYLSALLAHFGY